LRQAVDPDHLEIVPTGAGKTAADFIVEPDLLMSSQRDLHHRPEDISAFFPGDPSRRDEAHDVVGQPVDKLDHRLAPLICESASLRFSGVGFQIRSGP
jgi:hypothetical protein